jgi:hypothetical protein
MNTYTVTVETLRRHGFSKTITDTTTWIVGGDSIEVAMRDAIDCAWRANDYLQIALKARVVSVVANYGEPIETESEDSYRVIL